MKNTQATPKCQYAAPGTYGHECGAPATHVQVTVMTQSTKDCFNGLGVAIPADGLSRAGRCELHRNRRETGSGAFVRNEGVAK